MGIDLFCAPGTPVMAPLDGTVEYLANNTAELDYGPMVILRHADGAGKDFFTLYGHLSLDTLERVAAGQTVRAGEQIASVGEPPINGNWPPHLHFQLIDDLLDLGVNFPGVACASQQSYWLGVSPSPGRFFPECASELLEYK
jgi:murein DD-endopeptidase MepM/ murein hydrolase activator NlpD